ncbi:MAG: cytidylate kinase family protein [Acidobacteria bacterium]|nr:cytidylate kinase family protein [Acidobacteriota bacterium]
MSIITISRGTFSGGRDLAECLHKQLGYSVASREIVADAAQVSGVSEAALSRALESSPRLVDRFLPDRRLYLAFVRMALCERAAHDNLVYHGHAGHFLLKGVRHVIRVRLIAPLDFRIDRLRKRMGLDEREAAAYIERVDKERSRWTEFLYGADWKDPSLYDLVVNLENVDLEGACGAVVALAARPQFQADDSSRQTMMDLLLMSQVAATLAADRGTSYAEVEVRAKAGLVEIEGKLADPMLVNAVIDRARRVAGVRGIRYGTRVMFEDSTALVP